MHCVCGGDISAGGVWNPFRTKALQSHATDTSTPRTTSELVCSHSTRWRHKHNKISKARGLETTMQFGLEATPTSCSIVFSTYSTVRRTVLPVDSSCCSSTFRVIFSPSTREVSLIFVSPSRVLILSLGKAAVDWSLACWER